jgi:exonuclease VII small subunit
MNNQDRKELERAIEMISEAKSIIESIKDGEQEKFDNLSEGLQQSEKGQKFEENVSSLYEAISSLDSAEDYINTASD